MINRMAIFYHFRMNSLNSVKERGSRGPFTLSTTCRAVGSAKAEQPSTSPTIIVA